MSPTVSICCLSYNHAPYIRKCLEGFMMQECNFNFEVLIHDDASTDGTPDIIKEFQEQYPDIIKPIFQEENQYSKGIKPTFKYNFPRAKGKYIAMCEGDDYWTDPLKLQKQVDFLRRNPSYVACFTNATIINEIENKEERYIQFDEYKKYGPSEIIRKGGALFPTASLVFRNQIKDWPDLIFKHKSGDRALALLLVDKGGFYLLNEVTCVYRRHSGGVFSSTLGNMEKRREIDESNIALLKEFNEYTSNKYQGVLTKVISKRALMVLLNEPNSLMGLRNDEIYKYLTFSDKLRLVKNKLYTRS